MEPAITMLSMESSSAAMLGSWVGAVLGLRCCSCPSSLAGENPGVLTHIWYSGSKLKGSQAKEKPSSEWKDRDMADFLMKLMDKSDESDEEEEEQVQKRLQETE
ncbi:transmembrane protein 190 isoform X2 [Alligator sinensis]|uniref:Transmembrane protein 190 isoform X2 n=1 Tax=Alligator sinensis TaxID=38654 RepID=A0A3Q0GZF7_ALLSI|nr:transmembrane protein 190 isoform X2 [Alligator sinensis]